MRAFRLTSFDTAPQVEEIADPTPAKGEALVDALKEALGADKLTAELERELRRLQRRRR